MLQAEDKIGPYTLIRRLGQGSVKVVWLAERRSEFAVIPVALGLIQDDAPDRKAIAAEAQVWLRAGGHPNVLPVMDVDEYDGQIVIVSEYAPDGSLQEWLKRHGGKAPSVESALQMMSGILAGLEHLHTRQPEPIIHRDLKFGNVLLQGETPLITDFGISRVLKTSLSTHISGTPAYMSPEMFDGVYSPQSDLWAAGVMLYKMLSGNMPFQQAGYGELMRSIERQSPEPLSEEILPSIRSVVSRALEKDPPRRFRSAKEMREALQPAVALLHKSILLPSAKYERAAPSSESVSSLTEAHSPQLPAPLTPATITSPSQNQPAVMAASFTPGDESIPTKPGRVPSYLWLLLLLPIVGGSFLVYRMAGNHPDANSSSVAVSNTNGGKSAEGNVSSQSSQGNPGGRDASQTKDKPISNRSGDNNSSQAAPSAPADVTAYLSFLKQFEEQKVTQINSSNSEVRDMTFSSLNDQLSPTQTKNGQRDSKDKQTTSQAAKGWEALIQKFERHPPPDACRTLYEKYKAHLQKIQSTHLAILKAMSKAQSDPQNALNELTHLQNESSQELDAITKQAQDALDALSAQYHLSKEIHIQD